MTDIITAFMAAIPEIILAYYEEADPSAAFPFCIVSGLDVQDLDFGHQLSLDVDHWTDEAPGNAAALESQCNALRMALDRKLISKTGAFNGIIYFENQQVIIDGEQDLIRRRQTFTVRAFCI